MTMRIVVLVLNSNYSIILLVEMVRAEQINTLMLINITLMCALAVDITVLMMIATIIENNHKNTLNLPTTISTRTTTQSQLQIRRAIVKIYKYRSSKNSKLQLQSE